MTAPALPGAAPDPAPGRNDTARLPPEVDAAIVEAVLAATNFGVDGRLSDLQKSQDAVVALRTAIARALGGDGEPVAWAVFAEDASVPAYVSSVKDRADQVVDSPAGRDECYRLVPLYTRPAATGDTVGAAARALVKAAIDARADEAVTGIIVPEAEWDALLAALRSTPGGGACG